MKTGAYFKDIHSILLIFIMILAAVLRVWNYWGFSFSNDELSALNRLNFDSLSELIYNGIRIDGHPAFTQMFLFYWVKLFGNSEFWLRLPFLAAGLLSVYFTYLVAFKLFNRNTALLTALGVALLEFPLLYSRLARPYSFAFLFSLMTVFYWAKIMEKNDKVRGYKLLVSYAPFVLSFLLAALTHHFSFLFVVIVYITGLFFINNAERKNYLLSAFAIFILYSPHLDIFFHQLSLGGVGGVGGWLEKPDAWCLLNHIAFIFNNSLFLITAILAIVIIILSQWKSKRVFNKYRCIAFLWFLIPFIIGLVYSLLVNPVLQNPVLLFSFPFLLMFLFSFIDEKLNKTFFLVFFLFFLTGLYSTVVEKAFFKKQHFGNFKEIAAKLELWNSQFGLNKNNCLVIINHPYYIDYYLKRPQLRSTGLFQTYENIKPSLLNHKLSLAQGHYFAYAILRPVRDEILAVIRERFPYIKDYYNYDGQSELYLFSDLKKDKTNNEAAPLYKETIKFNTLKTDSLMEFISGLSRKTAEINIGAFKSVHISLSGLITDSLNDMQLVLSLSNAGGKTKLWRSSFFKDFLIDGQPGKVFLFYKFSKPDDKLFFPNPFSKNDLINIYIWNPSKYSASIDSLNIEFY
ncbi:MAG: glycosyltransferase family 39 protein [Bacteroidales bacterium]|nr:glycosyltransferase family 39 protein [Bacteroidales bacterium]